MAVIYLHVLYFPLGLLGLLWRDAKTQYLFHEYQVYAILIMHVVPVRGWNRCGRTYAAALKRKKQVLLHDAAGCTISARLVSTSVPYVAAGRPRVNELIQRQLEQQFLNGKASISAKATG